MANIKILLKVLHYVVRELDILYFEYFRSISIKNIKSSDQLLILFKIKLLRQQIYHQPFCEIQICIHKRQ